MAHEQDRDTELMEVLLRQAREGDEAVAEVARLRHRIRCLERDLQHREVLDEAQVATWGRLDGEGRSMTEQQYVITSLNIDDVQVTLGEPHPERTPIGPFPSREAAWDYAQRMQLRHGRGGGSADVAPLIAPTEGGDRVDH